jgi:tight adherence protein B
VTAVAVALAALAAALLAGPGAVRHADAATSAPLPLRTALRGRARLVVVPVGGALLVASFDGPRLALAVIGFGAVCGAAALATRGRRRRRAERTEAKVVEVCEALVGELRAGQPLVACLERCVGVMPEFEPVAAAGRLDADVPSALRRLAALPGATGLRDVASAWEVSEGSGAGLASALGQVSASARETQATGRLVASELASAQATARMVAMLPLVTLAMSAGIGGHPWRFLLGTMPGLVCLGAGLGLAFAGLLWIDHIAAGVLDR